MALDRSDNLLVIAPDVPRHDWNSGDLRLFSMLKLLVAKFHVYYLPWTLEPGSQRYVKGLESIGVTVLPAGSSLSDAFRQHHFKAAILEFYSLAEYYLPRIRILEPACRVIVDTVDVHFLREEMRGRVTGDRDLLAEAARTKRRELAVYARADVVVTVTDEDARLVLDESSGVTVRVIPNIHEIVPPETPANGARLIFVGGFRHYPNVDAVLYFCQEILPLVRERLPEAHVTIVGSNPPPEILALREKHVEVTGFVPSTTPYLHASRVSIAPLRFGAGMKGKVGEAMAHGLPVVTTTVGAQGMGLQHGVNVLIADDPANFASAVLELLVNSELHGRISRNAMDYLSRNFTPLHVARRLSRVLEELETLPARRMALSEKVHFIRLWIVAKVRDLAGTPPQ